MNARDYYLRLQSAIHAAPHVLRSDVQFEEIDVNVSTFPNHRHDENDKPHTSSQMNLPDVLEVALRFILPSQSD